MSTRPTLFFLHFLGGSARSWSAVTERLDDRFACVVLDLPGFGEARDADGYSVEAMADTVAAAVARRAPGQWAMVGHSLGAKVAAAVARRAEDGQAGLGGLTALVLISGSPPSPEPMEDAQREAMLGWFGGDERSSRDEAAGYVGQNSASLHPDSHAAAVDDVVRAHPAAWRAWLESGSREDWSERVGVLDTPTLLVAGSDDPQLGPDGQTRFALPHYRHGRLTVVAGVKHLLPLERPDEAARLIGEHVGGAGR